MNTIKDVSKANKKTWVDRRYLSVFDNKNGKAELGAFLADMKECRELTLQMRQLEELPPLPPNLEYLSLSTPSLKSLPDFLTELPLDRLIISDSAIEVFPPAIFSMSSLYRIIIGSKKLRVLETPPVGTKIPLDSLTINCPMLEEMPHLGHFKTRDLSIWSGQLENVGNRLPDAKHLQYCRITAPLKKPFVLKSKGAVLKRLYIRNNQSERLLLPDLLPVSLTHLEIHSAPNLKKIPDFPKNSKLNTLLLDNCDAALPESISHCINVQKIQMNNWQNDHLPKGMRDCASLGELHINRSLIDSIPPQVLQLRRLTKLSIQFSKLQNLPPAKDWINLKNLIHLNITKNDLLITDFSFTNYLPFLSKFYCIRGNRLADYTLLHPRKLTFSDAIALPDVRMPKRDFLPFAAAVGKSRLKDEDKRFFHDAIKGIEKFKDTPKFPLEKIIKGMAVAHTVFRQQLQTQLQDIINSDKGLASMGSDMVLHITGKINLKRSEILAKLEEVGGSYSSKFSKKVTHLLIGMNPKYLPEYEEFRPKFINENSLQDYFSQEAPQFLETQEGNEGMGGNLGVLLGSDDDTNLELALEIIKTGGVPDKAHGELLVLSKTHDNYDIRRTAKQLLERYGDPAWLPMLADRTSFKWLFPHASEDALYERLHRLAGNTSPELAAVLSRAFQKRYGKGGQYAKILKRKKK